MTGVAAREAPTRIPLAHRRRVRRQLLTWYDGHRRDLPWRRRQGNAYAQWVAEVMLQQTRVDTVREYYLRFMKRFPTVRALASAPHDAVLKHWEGLGYYRRALHLHRAAKLLRDEHRAIPKTAAELRELPGLGDYTSAAIASIAFGERAAAVDGNVARVLARLFGIEEDVLSSRGKAVITNLAQELIPRARPGDFNQAWMDLGSAVCVPRSPCCGVCPLRRGCVAAATQRTGELPVRDGGRKSRIIPRVPLVSVIFVSEGRLLVQRRPTGGLWSGLWEFPTVERADGLSDAACVNAITGESGLTVGRRVVSVGAVRHKLTHRDLRFEVFVAVPVRKTRVSVGSRMQWVTPVELAGLSMSTAHRRVYEAAESSLATFLKDQASRV